MNRTKDWKEATSCNYDYSQIVMVDSLEIEEQRRRVQIENEILRDSEETRLQNRRMSEDIYYTEKVSFLLIVILIYRQMLYVIFMNR